MRIHRSLLQLALLIPIVLGSLPGLASEGKRIALVIGNSEYRHAPRLENPKNDAEDLSAALKQLGFTVVQGRDLDKAAMDRTIRDFAEMLVGAQAGLLFYAGHGLQVGGQNYLVPIDAKLTTAAALDFEMVRLDLVHRSMERAAAINILILDACRDNPLARNLARALGTRSSQIGRGLAAVESGEGTLISYSTQPGNVALDGHGRNSPFAAAFLKHMSSPGEDLPSILINVRNDVMKATERQQVPWEHSALTTKFYFKPPMMTIEQQMEATYWEAVKSSGNPSTIAAYLQKYPTGAFAGLANALIDELNKNAAAEKMTRDAQQKKLEADLKRLDEERKAAEAARLETARQAELARRASETEMQRLREDYSRPSLDRERAAVAELDQQLRKATEELKRARDAVSKSETERRDAQEAAEAARKAAQEAQAARAAEAKQVHDLQASFGHAQPGAPKSQGPYDGTWKITRVGASCSNGVTLTFHLIVSDGKVRTSSGGAGSVTSSGEVTFANPRKNSSTYFKGMLLSNSSGSGTFSNPKSCSGTFTARKLS